MRVDPNQTDGGLKITTVKRYSERQLEHVRCANRRIVSYLHSKDIFVACSYNLDNCLEIFERGSSSDPKIDPEYPVHECRRHILIRLLNLANAYYSFSEHHKRLAKIEGYRAEFEAVHVARPHDLRLLGILRKILTHQGFIKIDLKQDMSIGKPVKLVIIIDLEYLSTLCPREDRRELQSIVGEIGTEIDLQTYLEDLSISLYHHATSLYQLLAKNFAEYAKTLVEEVHEHRSYDSMFAIGDVRSSDAGDVEANIEYLQIVQAEEVLRA